MKTYELQKKRRKLGFLRLFHRHDGPLELSKWWVQWNLGSSRSTALAWAFRWGRQRPGLEWNLLRLKGFLITASRHPWKKKNEIVIFFLWNFFYQITYLNFSLMTTQFPSLVNRISWVIQERLSLDLDWVLIFWSSSMISWICFWTSSPIRKKNQNIFFWWRFKFKHLAHTHTLQSWKEVFLTVAKIKLFAKILRSFLVHFFFKEPYYSTLFSNVSKALV